MSEVKLNRQEIHAIRFCVMDNDNGPVAYCYEESVAEKIVAGLNHVHDIDPVEEGERNGYNRFAYEDMQQYPADGHLPALIMAQLALGFFGKFSNKEIEIAQKFIRR